MSATAHQREQGHATRWWRDPRTLGGLAISAISLVGVLWWALRQEAPPWPDGVGAYALLAAAVAVDAVGYGLRAWRWHTILHLDGVELPYRHSLGITFVGYMGNTVLPLRGGELLRVLLVRRQAEGGRRQILGSILAERILDALVLAGFFVILTAIGIAGAPLGTLPAALTAAAIALGALALWLYLRGRRAGRFARFADTVRPFVRASRPMIGKAGLGPLGASVVVWLLVGVVFLLVARALDLQIGWSDGVFLAIFASALALVPAAPGYVGTFDAAIVFGLHSLGIEGGETLAFALLIRLVLFVPPTAVGLVLALARYGGLGLRGSAALDRAYRADEDRAPAS